MLVPPLVHTQNINMDPVPNNSGNPRNNFISTGIPNDLVGLQKLLKSLKDIENLEITTFEGGAILKGELLTPEDLKRVSTVADSFSNVFNLCSLHGEALETAAIYIREAMVSIGIHGLDMKVLGKNLFLTGRPASMDDVKRVERICEALGLSFIDGTREQITDPRMLIFEINFTEINKQAFREIGIDWPSSIALSDPSGFRLSRLSPEKSLEMMISVAALTGKARILSSPRLVCRSGESASFLAGGEIAIPRRDKDGQITVTWKRYGIILEINPRLDSDGLIHARITSEVSMVDHSNSIEGIPGILTRKISTYLSLASGQTAVLSGLINNEDAENITKIPLLGDIPVLGELFKSRSFKKRETELLVFLTPRIVDPDHLLPDISDNQKVGL